MHTSEGQPLVESGQTASDFQSTMWSLVLSARADREHLERLLRLYWSPVYGWIRRQGFTGHDASDLTQEFMSRVVVGRDLVGKADPTRGRFRAFLKQSLRNFLIDHHRKVKISRSVSGDGTGLEATGGESGTAAPERDSDDFDRRWAASVVELALQRLEDDCLADSMEAHWTAFSINVLGPAVRKTAPLPMQKLAARIGASDADQASNMIQTVKRRFRKILRDVVRETVREPGMVEEELAELRLHLGG